MTPTVRDILKSPSFNESRVMGGSEGLTRPVQSIRMLHSPQGWDKVDPHAFILARNDIARGLFERPRWSQWLADKKIAGLGIIAARHLPAPLVESIRQAANSHQIPVLDLPDSFEYDESDISGPTQGSDPTAQVSQLLGSTDEWPHWYARFEQSLPFPVIWQRYSFELPGAPLIPTSSTRAWREPIWFGDEFFGWLERTDKVTTDKSSDGFLFQHAAKVLGWKIQQELATKTACLMTWLERPDPKGGDACVEYWPTPLMTAVVGIPPHSPASGHVRTLLNELRTLPLLASLRPAYWAMDGQVLMVFQEHPEMLDWLGKAREALQKALGQPITIGLSGPFNQLEDWPRGYREARLHWQHGWSANRQGGVFYDSRQAFWSLGQHLEPHVRDELIERILGPLLEARSSSILLETLMVYFASGGRLDVAANELYVHRNTLVYRLKRVEEILQRDLHNPDDLVDIRLAMSLWQARDPRITGFPFESPVLSQKSFGPKNSSV
ncbi:putative transcriptional regulator, PucR family [Sulfobacillus acidophilus DSM 10332]|uniref:Transcriptional regulator, PucR family n=1 Tax=Sulfobacillus acidophilus (strain ATCC 700253 / DSM 10332 / NAL) TaxID=679936 RepID=G8TSL8_SULAD|nr:putative transcriptional regulator, PucR family [Sulfobacillus acidophilus DSM 10332]